MAPDRNIAHNRNKHIEFYMGTYISMKECGAKKS